MDDILVQTCLGTNEENPASRYYSEQKMQVFKKKK